MKEEEIFSKNMILSTELRSAEDEEDVKETLKLRRLNVKKDNR